MVPYRYDGTPVPDCVTRALQRWPTLRRRTSILRPVETTPSIQIDSDGDSDDGESDDGSSSHGPSDSEDPDSDHDMDNHENHAHPHQNAINHSLEGKETLQEVAEGKDQLAVAHPPSIPKPGSLRTPHFSSDPASLSSIAGSVPPASSDFLQATLRHDNPTNIYPLTTTNPLYLAQALLRPSICQRKAQVMLSEVTSISRPLRTLQPAAAAAAMFQQAFNKATGAGICKGRESNRRRLELKLGMRDTPLNHLRWAFKLVHGSAISSISNRVAVDERETDLIEPHPREVIADYLAHNYKMMYVSGETGEPSVETTGIIEDIVRQQVIEIVSLVSRN